MLQLPGRTMKNIICCMSDIHKHKIHEQTFGITGSFQFLAIIVTGPYQSVEQAWLTTSGCLVDVVGRLDDELRAEGHQQEAER